LCLACRYNTNQMNTIHYFEIQSSDPARDTKFYEKVFGWKFTRDKSLPIEYYRVEMHGMMGGLLKRPAAIPPTNCGTNAFVCSIEVKNFDKTADAITTTGGQVALPKFAVPGKCWQGYFLDPDNNTFGIFEVDENAE
jgi:predicted enzyme related to lactoylglutathione lyase